MIRILQFFGLDIRRTQHGILWKRAKRTIHLSWVPAPKEKPAAPPPAP